MVLLNFGFRIVDFGLDKTLSVGEAKSSFSLNPKPETG
jgi:hypothetical protein